MRRLLPPRDFEIGNQTFHPSLVSFVADNKALKLFTDAICLAPGHGYRKVHIISMLLLLLLSLLLAKPGEVRRPVCLFPVFLRVCVKTCLAHLAERPHGRIGSSVGRELSPILGAVPAKHFPAHATVTLLLEDFSGEPLVTRRITAFARLNCTLPVAALQGGNSRWGKAVRALTVTEIYRLEKRAERRRSFVILQHGDHRVHRDGTSTILLHRSWSVQNVRTCPSIYLTRWEGNC